jgi:para-nitrobenzyl esterase
MTISSTVVTTTGAVRGGVAGGIRRYLAIPYAAPAVGAARFAAPTPHGPWSGIRDAGRLGPTAPQPRRDMFGQLDMSPFFGPGWIRGSDYRTVNIWAPRQARTRPVMVFVHGGGFVAGCNGAALYDGSAFARDGVVLVTVNHRLGIAGFLDLADAPRNRGLLDVVAALGWVRDNIAAFGGDPTNVTVFGQSAGATLVGALLATPEARGLFRRAIMQSGSGLGAFTPEQAARVTTAAAGVLRVEPTAAGFRDIPDRRLVEAVNELSGIDLQTADRFDPLVGLSPFSVVLDRQPAELHRAKVDLLIGTNAEEGNLYLAPQGALSVTTDADLRRVAAQVHRDPAALVAAYRGALPSAGRGRLRSAILGDALFVRGSRALAATYRGAYGYEFAWRSSALDGHLGAAHTVELPFVFDRLDAPGLRGPRGQLGAGEPPKALAAQMHAAWVSFARTGDPGWAPVGGSGRIRRFGGAAADEGLSRWSGLPGTPG